MSKRIIHCLVDAEPTTFHDQPAAYAVNLSFEWLSDESTDQSTQGEERNARNDFETFCELAAEGVEFFVYERVGDQLVQPRPVKKQLPATSEPTGAAHDVYSWLSRLDPNKLSSEFGQDPAEPSVRFWTSRDAGTAVSETEAEKAGAAARLRAAQAWDAPAAQMSGLTYLVWLDAPIQDAQAPDSVLLPIFGGGVAPDAVKVEGHPQADLPTAELFDCVDGLGSGLEEARCRTARLKGQEVDDLGGRLTDEGFFKINPEAEALRRFLNAFEQRVGSLMASAPALAKQADLPDDDRYEALFGIEDGTDTAGKAIKTLPARAAWAAAVGLIAALDMLVVAVMKPVTGKRSEGEVIAPLVSAILKRLEKIDSPDWPPDTELPSASVIAQKVRALLATAGLTAGDVGKPGAIARRMHGLGDAPASDASPEVRLLHRLLDHVDGSDPRLPITLTDDEVRAIQKDLPLSFILRPVFEAEAKLQGEAGMEAAILRYFELSAAGRPSIAAALTDYLKNAIKPVPVDAALRQLTKAIEAAWGDYRARLDGTFNGAEAVRRAAGAEFVGALFDRLNRAGVAPHDFVRLIEPANFYRMRLAYTDNDPGCFGQITGALRRFDPPGGDLDIVQCHLDSVYRESMRGLADLAGNGVRFVPDTVPQPLPLQVAADISGDLFDDFLSDFNGIAMAIRRIDDHGKQEDVFAHANLAELHWQAGTASERTRQVPCAISPILPAVSDGRGPMFVEYHGFPFAAASSEGVMTDEEPDGALREPFYSAEIAEPEAADVKQPRLPGLAYGRWFQSYAFPTTNAGTLPRRLQLSDDEPWLPTVPPLPYDERIDAPDNGGVVAWHACQRRTAIGEMDVVELDGNDPVPPGKERIGKALKDVVALASDYPRLALLATATAPGTLDLFREADGFGTLGVAGRSARLVVTLDEIASTGPGALTLRIFDGPAEGPADIGLLTSGSSTIGETPRMLAISFTHVAPAPTSHEPSAIVAEDATADPSASAPTNKIRIAYAANGGDEIELGIVDAEPDQLFWLRLVLTVDDAEKSHASLSFATPAGAGGSRPPARLLLLAPPEKDTWVADVPRKVRLRIATPRVGYLDFVRWMTNPLLRSRALGTHADEFMKDLSAAYNLRHLDEDVAKALDRLPDPAVDAVRLSLASTDAVGDGEAFAPAEGQVSLRGRLRDVAAQWSKVRRTKTPSAQSKTQPPPETMPLPLLFKMLDEAFRLRVEVVGEAGRSLERGGETGMDVTARVPKGVLADLSIEALILAEQFGDAHDAESDRSKHPSIIHKGLLQYASRSGRDHVAFPSLALRVETMIDALPDRAIAAALAGRMIAVAPTGSARRYDLVAPSPGGVSLKDGQAWRLFSHVHVVSQRWSPTGRPLYRAFSPKDHAWEPPADTAAFRVDHARRPDPAGPDLDPSEVERRRQALHDFENEAFFDRPNLNSDPLTQKLAPLPAVTVLQDFPWDSPSATYFRHRFTLRSRYAGALIQAKRQQVDAFPLLSPGDPPRDRIPNTWTLRVAMMADLSRLQVTRPQLRALIPLTSAPGGDGTPPVLAVLQEPPFPHGGLADRVAAELKTGFGYGSEKPGEPIEIRDSRKEIGPDPRLDYRPTSEEDALRLGLSAEGPVGLTFDPIEADSPVFANSLFLLTPRALLDETPTLEEHFVGVSMRRYLDPDWTFITPTAATVSEEALSIEADRAWSIRLAGSESVLLSYQGRDGDVLKSSTVSDVLSLRVVKSALDGILREAKDEVEVARLPAGTAITLLHQPVSPGRYSLSILARPASENIAAGLGAAPLTMASFEWAPSAKALAPGGISLLLPAGAKAEPILASAPTSLSWTRTLRAFDRATIATLDRAPATERVAVAGLKAVITNREGSTTLVTVALDKRAKFLTASTESSPAALHVHRHLAYLLTRLVEGPGRPVEEFVQAGRFLGAVGETCIEPALTKDERLNLRLVEIETPAAILGYTDDDTVPSTYRKHYFDLAATKCKPTDGLTLFLRLVGPACHLKKFGGLRLNLWWGPPAPDGERLRSQAQPHTDKKATIAIPFGGKIVRAAEVEFGGNSCSARLIYLDGTCDVAMVVIEPPGALSLGGEGFFLSVDAEGASDAAKFLCDVSLLHGTTHGPGTFDFDWLFSPNTGGDVARAFTPEELRDRGEPQARIVSVSPPMPARLA